MDRANVITATETVITTHQETGLHVRHVKAREVVRHAKDQENVSSVKALVKTEKNYLQTC